MVWLAAAAMSVQVASSLIGGRKQAKLAARQEQAQIKAQSEAESRAIIKDRLAQTVRNSYQAALMQSQLALKKQQAQGLSAGIRAQGLAAQGAAAANAAATGNTGASVAAVSADIQAKQDVAEAQNLLNYAADVDNHNRELDAMVMNTKLSAPDGTRNYQSSGHMSAWRSQAGLEIANSVAQFGFGYAQRRMSLSLGNNSGMKSGMPSGSLSKPQLSLSRF